MKLMATVAHLVCDDDVAAGAELLIEWAVGSTWSLTPDPWENGYDADSLFVTKNFTVSYSLHSQQLKATVPSRVRRSSFDKDGEIH